MMVWRLHGFGFLVSMGMMESWNAGGKLQHLTVRGKMDIIAMGSKTRRVTKVFDLLGSMMMADRS